MNIRDFFKNNKPKRERLPINKKVHDDINKFTAHMLKVKNQARVVDGKIEEAKKETEKLQEMLTLTQRIILSSRGEQQTPYDTP